MELALSSRSTFPTGYRTQMLRCERSAGHLGCDQDDFGAIAEAASWRRRASRPLSLPTRSRCCSSPKSQRPDRRRLAHPVHRHQLTAVRTAASRRPASAFCSSPRAVRFDVAVRSPGATKCVADSGQEANQVGRLFPCLLVVVSQHPEVLNVVERAPLWQSFTDPAVEAGHAVTVLQPAAERSARMERPLRRGRQRPSRPPSTTAPTGMQFPFPEGQPHPVEMAERRSASIGLVDAPASE